MPAPKDKKSIQRLLGSLNFFARYIPNMSTITHPLRELLGKNVPFHWTKTHDQALEEIKKILANAPVLGYYNVNKTVILEADASSHGLGAVILQVLSNVPHEVIFEQLSYTKTAQLKEIRRTFAANFANIRRTRAALFANFAAHRAV